MESIDYGVLTVAESGEDKYQIVITGKLRGSMIYRNGVGVMPLSIDKEPVDFKQWFAYWANEDLDINKFLS